MLLFQFGSLRPRQHSPPEPKERPGDYSHGDVCPRCEAAHLIDVKRTGEWHLVCEQCRYRPASDSENSENV
ncbi:hypothetical protein SAMN05216388_102649 [Halorientalis persicus]|uniref:Uncharacterized protein n=1 Tax=Halorientalis persicus TaxID=1367881 RepID=A0A1H8UAQ6_9EURY|nr:hypothetical protein SAMN05216388_102649 [Halorientalis persicus]